MCDNPASRVLSLPLQRLMADSDMDPPEFGRISGEMEWVNLQPEFERLGYRFRPRYRVDWVPSWRGQAHDNEFLPEDSLWIYVGCADAAPPSSERLLKGPVLDAVRQRDGCRVFVKRLEANEHGRREEAITTFLARDQWGQRTPAVPVLDVLRIPACPEAVFLVLAELVPWDYCPFEQLIEVVDFVRQLVQVSHGHAMQRSGLTSAGTGVPTCK